MRAKSELPCPAKKNISAGMREKRGMRKEKYAPCPAKKNISARVRKKRGIGRKNELPCPAKTNICAGTREKRGMGRKNELLCPTQSIFDQVRVKNGVWKLRHARQLPICRGLGLPFYGYAMHHFDSAALHLAVGLSPNKSKIKTGRECINALQPVLFYPYSACSLAKVSL